VIYGVDLSRYQAGISLHGVRSEGFDFAFCKVSQGGDYRSPEWPRMRDEARAAGLILAGYHYIDRSDPARQAANCGGHLGDLSIPVALDLEEGGGDIAQYRRVLDAFTAAGIRVPLSYIPRWYWQEIGSPDLSDLPPLWASRYPSSAVDYASSLYQAIEQAGGGLSTYWEGYGGNRVAVLQYACTAVVQGRQVDADAYLGTRDELAALLGSTTPAPPPTEPGGMPTAQQIAAAVWEHPQATAVLSAAVRDALGSLNLRLFTDNAPKGATPDD
jgi:lysozyme